MQRPTTLYLNLSLFNWSALLNILMSMTLFLSLSLWVLTA
jgi:hypothetical protein